MRKLRIDGNYRFLYVSGAWSRLILPNYFVNVMNVNYVYKTIECTIDLDQMTWTHDDLNAIFGVRIELRILTPSAKRPDFDRYFPQVRQKIRIDLMATEITYWATSLISTADLFAHRMRHGVSWYNIETPNSYTRDHARDRLAVDRYTAFNTSNVLHYVQHMTTKKGVEWNILDDYQYPFDFNVIHYIGESGIDEGALSQDFFDNLYSALSQVITGSTVDDDRNGVVLHNEIEGDTIKQGVQALMRVTHLCFRMNENWKTRSREMSHRRSDVTLDCRLEHSTFNYRYFELSFGVMDHFVEGSGAEDFVNYLRILASEDVVEDWLPNFADKFFAGSLDKEEIEMIISRVDLEALGVDEETLDEVERFLICRDLPVDVQDQMQLIADYVYTVSCKGIIKVIRENLYYFGIIPSIQPMMWLDFDQFYSIFYSVPMFTGQDIQHLLGLLEDPDNWRNEGIADFEDHAGNLERCMTRLITGHYAFGDMKWIQNLLKFWTGKKWTIPSEITIYIRTIPNYQEQNTLVNLPRASACFNTLYLNEYMIHVPDYRVFNENTDCDYFEELIDIALTSTNVDGFGAQ